jgi:hypothetical protein
VRAAAIGFCAEVVVVGARAGARFQQVIAAFADGRIDPRAAR